MNTLYCLGMSTFEKVEAVIISLLWVGFIIAALAIFIVVVVWISDLCLNLIIEFRRWLSLPLVKKNYNQRILDLRDLWDGNKITHKYGEKFIYLDLNQCKREPKGHYRYVFFTGNHEESIDALFFFHTIKYELSEIKYAYCEEGIIGKLIDVPDRDYEFLKNIFKCDLLPNYLKQNDAGPAVTVASKPLSSPVNLPVKTINNERKI